MGGIFGVCSKTECVTDLFFGTDYHSHLGTRRGGMAVYDGQHFIRAIHNIENSPFRMKFESDLSDMTGHIGIGCISDSEPQPIILNSKLGTFAIVTVGRINNKKQLAEELIKKDNVCFSELSGGRINDAELVALLICRKNSIPDGIIYAQNVIEGSMTMLVCADMGIYAARDKKGRTPLSVANSVNGYCVSFESFAYINLGYKKCRELGPGEIVFITENKMTEIAKAGNEMRICSFLWTYYGYPPSVYEGVSVEEMRYRNGQSLAIEDKKNGSQIEIDYVAGVPDSGTAHAIGYSIQSGLPFARPLIKYTPTWPRSFLPHDQKMRSLVARMKLVPLNALIENKRLLLVEDSIVRGTQMHGTVDFLHAYGVKELHVRPACPPILFDCKYLKFTRSNSVKELVSRQAIEDLEGSCEKNIQEYTNYGSKSYRNMVEYIRKSLKLTSLEYHSLDGLMESIGIDKCKLCTHCWNGSC